MPALGASSPIFWAVDENPAMRRSDRRGIVTSPGRLNARRELAMRRCFWVRTTCAAPSRTGRQAHFMLRAEFEPAYHCSKKISLMPARARSSVFTVIS